MHGTSTLQSRLQSTSGPLKPRVEFKEARKDLDRLQSHIASNQLKDAMELFRELRVPPSSETMQRLAVLLSKHDVESVKRGHEVLKDLYS